MVLGGFFHQDLDEHHSRVILRDMDGNIWRDLESSGWSLPHPGHCLCRGHGWMLSPFDTWHRCAVHGKGVPHPEDDMTEFDFEEHFRLMCRKAFAYFREGTQMTSAAFLEEATKRLSCPRDKATPLDWVDAAEATLADFAR